MLSLLGFGKRERERDRDRDRDRDRGCGWYSDSEGDSWVGVAVGPSEAKPAPREEEGWMRG